MSMTNFMPWRQQRRVRCLRFWAVAFAATLLLVLMVFFQFEDEQRCETASPAKSELMGTQSVQHALASRRDRPPQGRYPRSGPSA